ncbi:MAG: sensor histidine kinase [Saprospiraceae bacterium]
MNDLKIMKANANKSLKLLSHMTFWILISTLFVVVFLQTMAWQDAVGRAILHIFLLIVLCYANTEIVIKRFFLRSRYIWTILLTLLLFGGITFLRGIVNLWFPGVELEVSNFDQEGNAYFAAMLTNLGFLAISTVYQLMENRFQSERRREQLENERNAAELQFLKSQINPHFLFNTLNNIYSLAVMRSDRTAPMVLQLSELLRYVIYESHKEQLDLLREVLVLERYIELFKMRCEEEPNIIFVKDGQFVGQLIEPMLLIPLVENCFKHTDLLTNPKSFIQITIDLNQQILTFTTKNTYDRSDQQQDKTGGVGLQNIRHRLKLRYPHFHELRIDKGIDVFSVTLKVKLRQQFLK